MGEGFADPSGPIEKRPPGSLFDRPLLEVEKGFHIVLDTSVSYGWISGYVQTPRGGAPSSTSEKRPTLKELGIDAATVFNISLSASLDSHLLYGAAHLLDLNGENTLQENLVFHGKQYPAGTRVEADVTLNWYEIGYQYNIHFAKQGNLSIAPTVAVALWDFSAQLQSDGIKDDRSYMKATPRVGLEFKWAPLKKFLVTGKAVGSLPIQHLPGIYTLGLTGKYMLVNKDRFRILLGLGIGYDWMRFEDSQQVPNRISANIGPLGVLGVEIEY